MYVCKLSQKTQCTCHHICFRTFVSFIIWSLNSDTSYWHSLLSEAGCSTNCYVLPADVSASACPPSKFTYPSGNQYCKMYTSYSCKMHAQGDSGYLSIPGTGWSRRKKSKRWLVKRWKHTPDATLPARPFLCKALARDTHTVSRLSMPLHWSYLSHTPTFNPLLQMSLLVSWTIWSSPSFHYHTLCFSHFISVSVSFIIVILY